MRYDFIEVCGGAGKVSAALDKIGFVAGPNLDPSFSGRYGLSDIRALEWLIPLVQLSHRQPALLADPAEPLGFDRQNPKVLRSNVLAFRSLVLIYVCHRVGAGAALEQSRLSKMAWFSLAVTAECWVFGSSRRLLPIWAPP